MSFIENKSKYLSNMKYKKIANTNLIVSSICLGTMGFGGPNNGFSKWALKEGQSRKIIKQALNSGINFFDTANFYSYGNSEKILGKALNDYAKRNQVIISTKVYMKMKKNNLFYGGGLSRTEIFRQVDASLKRLHTNYIDLYIIHRWDYKTPIEETMEALNDLIKIGKVRYIGASAIYAWQFMKAQAVAKVHGWHQFVSMQNHWNLIYREEEREMVPLCRDQNIAITPYSPLASGRLARNWTANSKRFLTDKIDRRRYEKNKLIDKPIVNRIGIIAKKYHAKRSQIALAWLLQKKGVISPVIGVTKIAQLQEDLASLNLKLTNNDIKYLEELYIPHPVEGPY